MSDLPPLTVEQQGVVDSSAQRIAIVASAGAGKTRVIVERYLSHVLRDHIDPDQILAITFTRKAAAEMKERIVKGLRDAKAFNEAQIAETGPIQTIHALCEQILRENAVVAGLDAKFEILSETQSVRFQLEAIEEAIATLGMDCPEGEGLIASLAGKRSYGGTSPYSLLQSSVLTALGNLRGTGISRTEVANIFSDPAVFSGHWQAQIIASQPSVVVDEFHLKTGPDWRQNLKESFKAARTAVPNWLRSIPDPDEDIRLEKNTCGVVQIALEAWNLVETRMYEAQSFDFSDLEVLTVRLLEANPDLCSRLTEKFEIVMVDEAQDLNQSQYRIIEFLGKGHLLTVGDGQQSIYGFRHADLDRFHETHATGAQRLTKNFRSRPGIVRFIDQFFGGTWCQGYVPMLEPVGFDLDSDGEVDFEGVEFWELPNLEATAAYIGRIIDDQVNPVKEGDICVLARDSKSCQAIHEGLSKIGIESRIHGGTEKFYTRMEVRDLANLLRALSDPYHDFSLLAVLRSPIVGLSIDGLSRLGLNKPIIDFVAETEVGDQDRKKLDRFLEWFNPLRAYADRLSAWEVLSEVFAATPFLEAISLAENGSQQLSNVRKLLVLASQDSHLGPLEFADQIRYIQALKHKEGDAEEVRDNSKLVTIMTIHKAKGLEFPVVVLPETSKSLGGSASDILFDPKLKLLAARLDRSGNGLLHKFLESRKKSKEVEEELRILYVAMTRAKSRLCIALYPPTSKDTISKRMRKAFGEPFPDSIRVRTPIDIA